MGQAGGSALRRRTLEAGGEAGRLAAALTAATCPLGACEDWDAALCAALGMILPARAEIVLFWGADYVAFYNDAYAPTIGVKHPGALGRPARENWAELWDDLHPLLSHVRETGETFHAEDRAFYIERAGYGEEVYFDVSYSPVPAADGTVAGVLCIVSETTDRVRASRAIAADRERLGRMFDQAPGFMAVLRYPGYAIELANRSFHALVGPRPLVGLTLVDAVPEFAREGLLARLEAAGTSATAVRDTDVAFHFERADGSADRRRVDLVLQPVTDAEGKVTAIFVEGTDLTERYAAESELDAREQSLTLATDAAEIGTWDYDPRTRKLVWGAHSRVLFGFSADDPVTTETFFDALLPADRGATQEALGAALDPARRAAYEIEYRVRRRGDGAVRWIAARGRGLFEGDTCVRAVGIVVDITAQRTLADALAESEERFRTLADDAPALIWLSDAEGRVTFVNRWFETALGYPREALLGRGWEVIIPAEDREAVHRRRARMAEQPRAWGGDFRVEDRGGGTRWLHAEARPRFHAGAYAGAVGCAVDVTEAHQAADALARGIAERTAELAEANARLTEQVTERERVEATLQQMQRLEAIGQLTSGVAHDFNNLLTVIVGNVGMVERAAQAAGLPDRTRAQLENIRTAAQRGATLTAQLLAFARRTRLEARAVDLNETVAAMRGLLESSIGGSVAMETELAPDLWPALADVTQLELVILNLAINARDAMAVGGTLRISTANLVAPPPERPEDPPAGEHVVIAVRDTGSGMSEAVRARVFEPFFTTKEVGKGSGLGLAQVFGIAKQSGGGVRIETAEGEGTTVSVFVPRCEPEAAATVPVAEPQHAGASLAGRTVLVLDDDDAVRAVTVEELRAAGARVVEAASGSAALEALAAEPGVALAVADFAMPGMNGAEFARAAAALRPDLPVVFVTGFADLSAIAEVPRERVVQKPFAPGAVADRARRALA